MPKAAGLGVSGELSAISPDWRLLSQRPVPAAPGDFCIQGSRAVRPDRIIIGEVRDGEALAMLKTWNAGHTSGVTIPQNAKGSS